MRYRDTKTGRFASRATWKRSKAQGGTRYKRVSNEKTNKQKSNKKITRQGTPRKHKSDQGSGNRKLVHERSPKETPEQQIALREYFFVVFWKYKKGTRQINRRTPEAILAARDGATEEELKELYADWLIKETKWKEADVYRIVYQPNAGRQTEFRIVERSDPGSTVPPGTVQPNDTRAEYGPGGKGFKPNKQRTERIKAGTATKKNKKRKK